MRSLIYFTRELPGLSEDLSEKGFQVYEALAVSEVLYLAEQHPRLIVVIDHTVESDAAKEIAGRHITLKLKKTATVQDVVGNCRVAAFGADPVGNRDPTSGDLYWLDVRCPKGIS